jgi:F-type H+-transporting ATPase subunit epsilon
MPIALAIVTPEKEALALTCDEVIAPGVNGEIGLLPGHVPLITALRPGVLTVIHGGRKSYYAVSSGFAEVDADQVTVLTAACEPADQIDVERARKALSDAEGKLEKLGPEDPGYDAARFQIERARARLDTVDRKS